MATRKASMAAKVRFDHIPADGKTPVFDNAANKWIYTSNPTEAMVSATTSKLSTAVLQASSALTKADAAMEVADTKATAEEAVNEVKDVLFEIEDKDGNPMTPTVFKITERPEGFLFEVCAVRRPAASSVGSDNKNYIPFCLRLAYALNSDLTSMEARVRAIEKKLGIS